MRNFILVAALLGGCTGGANPSNPGEITDPGGNDGDDTAPKAGKATITYDLAIMGAIEACQINVTCDGETLSVPSGETVEVEAPASCVITAGIEVQDFNFPVHPDTKGEYWAAPPLNLDLNADDDQVGAFTGFNLFKPGNYDCSYDRYDLDEDAANLKGEQWMDSHPVDEQFIKVGEDGIVYPEDDQNMDVIGGPRSYLQAIDDRLVLLDEGDEDPPFYITESDIGVDTFSLTVVNTELASVSDIRCELDE